MRAVRAGRRPTLPPPRPQTKLKKSRTRLLCETMPAAEPQALVAAAQVSGGGDDVEVLEGATSTMPSEASSLDAGGVRQQAPGSAPLGLCGGCSRAASHTTWSLLRVPATWAPLGRRSGEAHVLFRHRSGAGRMARECVAGSQPSSPLGEPRFCCGQAESGAPASVRGVRCSPVLPLRCLPVHLA